MKKFFKATGYVLPVVVLVAIVTFSSLYLASCNDQKVPNGKPLDAPKEELYTGLLPAADTDGIRYTLHLEYDEDHNFKGGDYHLIQTYVVEDTTQHMHTRDIHSSNSEGLFEVRDGSGDDFNKHYIVLTPDRNSNGDVLYLLIDNDSTLVLVDKNLQPSENVDLNYKLKLVPQK